jgi:hypothetical protein
LGKITVEEARDLSALLADWRGAYHQIELLARIERLEQLQGDGDSD